MGCSQSLNSNSSREKSNIVDEERSVPSSAVESNADTSLPRKHTKEEVEIEQHRVNAKTIKGLEKLHSVASLPGDLYQSNKLEKSLLGRNRSFSFTLLNVADSVKRLSDQSKDTSKIIKDCSDESKTNNNVECQKNIVTISFSDGSVYSGNVLNKKFHGEGTLNHSDGSKYVGQWKNGEMDGHGEYFEPDGTKYEGEWCNGCKCGKGSEISGDKTYVYDGEYRDDDKNGFGKLTIRSPDTLEEITTYNGSFSDGLYHGQGTLTWNKGMFSQYCGDFLNGMMHGEGKLTYRDGRIIDGPFINNGIHGIATELWSRGDKRCGLWENGKFVKWLEQKRLDETRLSGATVADNKISTSAFSNPEFYHDLLPSADKKKLQGEKPKINIEKNPKS